jgi:hypothetical protein
MNLTAFWSAMLGTITKHYGGHSLDLLNLAGQQIS